MTDTATSEAPGVDTSDKIFRLPQNAAELIPLKTELEDEIASIDERINRAQVQRANKVGRLQKVIERISEEKASGTDFTEAAKKLVADREAELAKLRAEFGL